ncbi:hypothetical protein HYY74_03670 [Candidatus Woesearchaeota archaeon]|nr:hypothetical protein [Candidatus Woesearchaeota archaeon]
MINPVGAAKTAYNAGRGFAGWLVPSAGMDQSKLESIVDKLAKDDRVRNILSANPGLRDRLKSSVMDTYAENENLRRMAGYVDVADKLLVPIDVVADYMKIMGGVGYGLSAAKEIAEAAFKLPYMAYYTVKTGDVVGTLGNLLWEGLSWLIPGSLLDLTNRYANQADSYIERTSADKFVKLYSAEKEPAHEGSPSRLGRPPARQPDFQYSPA